MVGQISAWLTAIFMLEFAVGLLLVFGGSGVPWHRRLIAALFGLGFLILFIVVAYNILSGQHQFEFDLKYLAIVFVFANLLGFRLFLYVREHPPSCLGTLGKMAGCLAVGIIATMVLVFGLGATIGLIGYLGR